MVDGADRARLLGLVRRARRAARAAATSCATATRRSGSTAATARSATCSSTSDPRTSPRSCITHEHPDHCVDIYGLHVLLRYGLEREGLPVFAPEGVEKHARRPGRATGATRSTGTPSATATPPTVGDIDLRFSRTDHPPPTFAVEAAADGRRLVYTADTGPDWSVDAFGPGADLVLSEATYLHDDIPVADPPLGPAGRRGGARGRGRQRLMLTHLWPRSTRRPRSRKARRRSASAVTLAAPHLVTDDLTAADRAGRDTWASARDGREPDDLRPLAFTRDYTEFATGSVLVEFGRTRVLCTASVEERVPPWLRGKGRGWVTAEYSMLPGSTPERVDREAAKGKQSRPHPGDPAAHRPLAARGHRPRDAGRGADHRRLRRAAGRRRHPHRVDLRRLRRAARRVLPARRGQEASPAHPLTDPCAAISVGIVDALPCLDLDYSEDVARRGRHERRDDRRGPVRRGAGHRRGRGVHPRRARRPARPRRARASPRSSPLQREMLADAAAAPRRP